MLALLILLSGIMGVFFVLLRVPPIWRLDVGAPGDVRFLEGFYQYEFTGDETITFRWSSPTAKLIPYGSHGGLSHIRLHIHSHRQTNDRHLHIHRQTQLLADFALAPGWRTYDILLPPDTVNSGFTPVPLALTTNQYDADNNDGRELGIPLDWVELDHLTATHTPLRMPLQRALIMLWTVGVLLGVLWLINTAPLALNFPHDQHRGEDHPIRNLALQATVLAGVLVFWLWCSPYTLAWAFAEITHWLALATGGVVVLAGLTVALRKVWGQRNVTGATYPHFPHFPHLSITRRGVLLGIGGIILVCHIVLFLPGAGASIPVAWQSSIVWLMVGVPGALLTWYVFCMEPDPLTRFFLAICGALTLPPFLLLLIQAIPGAVPGWMLVVACDVVGIVAGWLLWQQKAPRKENLPIPSPQATRHRFSYLLMLILVVGSFFRLMHLGSAEFQGDEGQPMIMAAGMLQGYDDILLMHRKGPMEILLPSVAMVVTERINEWGARLPFALMGVAGLLGCYLLAQHMLKSTAAGLLATLVIALDGFLIGFSRIVQYQNVVLLMTIAAIWLCWRFATDTETPHWYITLAACFAAVGVLGHYDGIFGIPAMGWLILYGGMKRGWRSGREWGRGLAPPIIAGVVLLALFYLPFVLHEHFAITVEYLLTMRIGERDKTGMFFNNLEDYYPLMTFYNTIPQVQALAIALVVGLLLWLLRYGRPRPLGWGLAALLLVGAGITIWKVSFFQLDSHTNWAIVAFGLPVVGLILSPATPLALRVLVLWFGFPFIAESFLIAEPNTHFYTMHVAAALLIGLAIVEVIRWLHQHRMVWGRSLLVLAGVGVLLFTLPYTYLIFVRQYPEYKRDFPDSRPNIYLASYGDKSPRGGYFGFPHTDGWKAIGELYRMGVLAGNYDSNQKSLITTWYIRDGIRGGTPPLYYFAVRAKGNLFIPDGYNPFGSVMVDGRRMLDIYSRVPLTQQRQIFHLEDYEDQFDAREIAFPIQWQFLELDIQAMQRDRESE
jgi:hypothetical protein